MQLPSNYLELVGAGVVALQDLATQIRVAATNAPQSPELWLSVRDYEGLAGRLADSGESEWRHGSADLLISPQDLAVLENLLVEGRCGPVVVPAARKEDLSRLLQFLRRYGNREFEFDDPSA